MGAAVVPRGAEGAATLGGEGEEAAALEGTRPFDGVAAADDAAVGEAGEEAAGAGVAAAAVWAWKTSQMGSSTW
eukprot:COSAG01_NODE_1092_length_11738_cov_18.025775_7_plen_74_part_00